MKEIVAAEYILFSHQAAIISECFLWHLKIFNALSLSCGIKDAKNSIDSEHNRGRRQRPSGKEKLVYNCCFSAAWQSLMNKKLTHISVKNKYSYSHFLGNNKIEKPTGKPLCMNNTNIV